MGKGRGPERGEERPHSAQLHYPTGELQAHTPRLGKSARDAEDHLTYCQKENEAVSPHATGPAHTPV